MPNYSNNKIIIGTGKLGRNLDRTEINKIIDTINYSIEKNIKLHVSCLYGNSIDILGKNIKNKLYSNYLLKIFFKDKISFFHQIYYFINSLKVSQPFDIQLDEYFDCKKLNELNLCIKYLKKNNLIKNVFFTPIKSSSMFFLKAPPQ